MDDDADNLNELMEQIQDTTEVATLSKPGNTGYFAHPEGTSSTGSNGGATVEGSKHNEETKSRFFEGEPDEEAYDVPNRDLFELFPDNEEVETHAPAVSSFHDGYNIGELLSMMRLDSGTAFERPSLVTQIAGIQYKIEQYINFNKLEQKSKKLFKLT